MKLGVNLILVSYEVTFNLVLAILFSKCSAAIKSAEDIVPGLSVKATIVLCIVEMLKGYHHCTADKSTSPSISLCEKRDPA